eukprot:GEMP01034420.1.p1 GENE.GEMP01034420.1~~GEMP01034420.1.p1  ORF type:complete len:228 (+),score=44.86 GEMP01034420.1:117-800(+)
MTRKQITIILAVVCSLCLLGGMFGLGFFVGQVSKSRPGTEGEGPPALHGGKTVELKLTTDQVDFMIQEYRKFPKNTSGQESLKLLPAWFLETYHAANNTDGMAEYNAFIGHYNDNRASFSRTHDLTAVIAEVRASHNNTGNLSHNNKVTSVGMHSNHHLRAPVFPDKVVTCCGWCHLPKACQVMFFTPIIGDLFCLCAPAGFEAPARKCCDLSNGKDPPPGQYKCPE